MTTREVGVPVRWTATSIVMVVSAVLLMGAGSFAQDAAPATPEPEQVPYEMYIAALDVHPIYDTPQTLFDLLIGRSLSFATCN